MLVPSTTQLTPLSTLQLAKKATTLLPLVNADRCSDLAALDQDYGHWTPNGIEFTVTCLTKKRSARHPRPLRKFYTQETSEQVTNLLQPKPLFVTSQKPIHRAKPGSISH